MITSQTLVLWAVMSFLAVTAQGVVSFFRKPKWVTRDAALNKNWRLIAIASTVAGLLSGALTFALAVFGHVVIFSVLPSALIGFIVFQSFFTDLRLFRVDRWIMRVATFSLFIHALWILNNYGNQAELVAFLIISLGVTALLFIPRFGDADGRALQLVVFSLYPIYGTNGVSLAMVGMVATIAVFVIVKSIVQREFSLKKLVTKSHIPAVPLILIPVLVILQLGNYFLIF